jgi:hypothetical protein
MEHESVRKLEGGSDRPDGKSGIKDHQTSLDLACDRVDLVAEPRGREQHLARQAHDAKWNGRVECCASRVLVGDDDEPGRIKPAPELIEIALDAARLRRKVIRHENVRHFATSLVAEVSFGERPLTDATPMAKRWHESRVRKQTDCPDLLDVDDDRVARLSVEYE